MRRGDARWRFEAPRALRFAERFAALVVHGAQLRFEAHEGRTRGFRRPSVSPRHCYFSLKARMRSL